MQMSGGPRGASVPMPAIMQQADANLSGVAAIFRA